MKRVTTKGKGFTLVEIIGVIIILGIILVITIPSINNVMSGSYMQTYEIDLESMKDAAKGYILKENISIPVGIQTRIELSDMITAGLIDQIVDPETKEICDGYVTVSGNDGNYIVHPYLKCGSSYESNNYNKTDFVLPVITLLGNNPVNINVGDIYKEPGLIAMDDVDGNITSRVIITGNINPNIAGVYALTYTVSDNADNDAIPVTRTINVVDNVPPIIEFETNGNSTYGKTRSTVVRVRDNAVLNNSSLKYQWTTSTTQPSETSFTTTFTNGGTITSPAGVTGDYYLWIISKDVSGNQSMTRSNVFKLDNTVPTITINGSASMTIYIGDIYTDAGATATDAHSGLNGSVISTGSVNPSAKGNYQITYSACDNVSPANCSSAVRTVTVQDVKAPVITMNGSNPTIVSGGSTYSDAGATAVDDADGNVTSKIVVTGTVNPSVLGSYTITYTVKDNSNNTASLTRTVNVVDNILPTITNASVPTNWTSTNKTITVTGSDSGLSGIAGYYISTSTTKPTLGSSWNASTSTMWTVSEPAGTYYIWIKDGAGNISASYTTVSVTNIDSIAPSVATSEVRLVNSTGSIRANSDTSWSKQTLWWGNFSATDAASGISSYQYSTGCTGTSSGTLSSSYTYSNNNYNFCIRAIDNAGNIGAWSTATYIKVDTTAPSVPTSEVRLVNSTGSIRANSDTSWSKQTLWWGNFSATDAASGISSYQYSTGCTGTSSGTLGGSYTYSNNNYNFCIRAVDNAGNASAWGTTTYIKADTTPPVITMNGSSPITIYVGDIYNDTGATATDNLSGLNGSVTSTNTVNPSKRGTYTVTYNVYDNATNPATSVTRTVIVQDIKAPVFTMLGSNPINIDAGTTYTDAGATAIDDSDGNVTSKITVSSNVNPNVGGVYTVTYNVCDNTSPANCSSATRTVNVYVTWYQTRTIAPATYYDNYSATSDTSYYCPSGYTSSGSGSSMTCSKITTASNIATTTYSCPSGYTSSGSGSSMTCSKIITASPSTTSGSAYCSESTYSISGGSCVRTVSCSGCAGQGVDCMNTKCGAGGYSNGSWSCGTSSCTATMLIRYSCSTGTNDSIYSSTCYYCPSGYTTSSSGSSTTCSKTTTASNIVSTTYSCPSGYTASGSGSSTTCSKTETTSNLSSTSYSCPFGGSLSGTTCYRGYYQCSSGTLSGSSCYGSWSAWTTTPSTSSSTLEVKTEKRLSSV